MTDPTHPASAPQPQTDEYPDFEHCVREEFGGYSDAIQFNIARAVRQAFVEGRIAEALACANVANSYRCKRQPCSCCETETWIYEALLYRVAARDNSRI